MNRQTLAMTKPPVAADITQASDILLNLAAKLTFHHILVVEQGGQLGQIVFAQLAGPLLRGFLAGEPRVVLCHAAGHRP